MPRIIDAHIHYADDSPEFLSLLDDMDIKLLNICFAADYDDDWRAQRTLYRHMQYVQPDRFAWCTTIDLPRFDDETYIASVLKSLEDDFAAGAVACKLWKNIGMAVRKPDGTLLMIDDPIFQPVADFLADNNHTLLIHMAEPLACWLPLDERSPHYNYYRTHPQWHMYNHPELPSHAELIEARDRFVEQNTNLRIVGAHLGSLEYDVDQVADRLDRFPNFAVDISARLGDLALQDSGKVREFFIEYQDRILFGTDVVMKIRPSMLADEERRAVLRQLRDEYEVHFSYLETPDQLSVRGIATRGINLPASVLEKIYRENALHWYPSLQDTA